MLAVPQQTVQADDEGLKGLPAFVCSNQGSYAETMIRRRIFILDNRVIQGNSTTAEA